MRQNEFKAKKIPNKRKASPSMTPSQEFSLLVDTLKRRGAIQADDFLKLLSESSAIFQNEANVLKINSPLVIVGDIHGQFYDLLSIFSIAGAIPQKTYLFLGDYVDRGKFCIETVTLLLHLKRRHPNNIFMLRGNHEDRMMTTHFNFKFECEKKYNSFVYEEVLDLFKKLPICALIDGQIFAVHAGISPKIRHIREINKINRFVEIKDNQSLCDLLWSDPSDIVTKDFVPNCMRRVSYYYSPTQSEEFLENNNLRVIIRGHELTNTGYKYQKSSLDQPLTITIFSAPNYCDTYQNRATIAVLSQNGLDIKDFRVSEHPFVLDNYMNAVELTLPMISSFTTQLFKILLSASQSKYKSKDESGKLQDLQTIRNVEHMEKYFYSNSFDLLKFLFGHAKRENEVQLKVEQEGFTEEMTMKFLAMQASDEAQKMPVLFGPRNIPFTRINLSLKHLKDIDREEETSFEDLP